MGLSDKVISVAGSTGSIGTQTLDVAQRLNIRVSALSANSNIELLEEQIRRFKPIIAAVYDEEKAKDLRLKVKDTATKIVSGMEGLCEAAAQKDADITITSIVGMIGIVPTLEAIKAKKQIGLANKETLVTAGEFIIEEAKRNNVKIIPVDSEHSAIFQCLQGCNDVKRELKRIILTASGGPFYSKNREDLKGITVGEALKHPNWNMGAKITIDSATLMNKGLEFIEACRLFDIEPSKIEVIIHRESVIHSMVEFVDNSVIAQLSIPDMRLPIQYAITYPSRFASPVNELSLTEYKTLSFDKPDLKTFKLLKLCMEAAETGGTMPCAVNAANEEAVSLFLENKISFTGLFDIVEDAVNSHKTTYNPSLEDILNTESKVREYIREISARQEFRE